MARVQDSTLRLLEEWNSEFKDASGGILHFWKVAFKINKKMQFFFYINMPLILEKLFPHLISPCKVLKGFKILYIFSIYVYSYSFWICCFKNKGYCCMYIPFHSKFKLLPQFTPLKCSKILLDFGCSKCQVSSAPCFFCRRCLVFPSGALPICNFLPSPNVFSEEANCHACFLGWIQQRAYLK